MKKIRSIYFSALFVAKFLIILLSRFLFSFHFWFILLVVSGIFSFVKDGTNDQYVFDSITNCHFWWMILIKMGAPIVFFISIFCVSLSFWDFDSDRQADNELDIKERKLKNWLRDKLQE